jgi:hypothetical protein
MNKYPLMGKLLVVVITLIFIGTTINLSTAQETKKSLTAGIVTNPFITYPAIITIYIDNTSIALLNNPITPGTSILIHFLIGYCVIVPNWLLRPPFRILKYIFLFNTPVVFPQKISLSVKNVPSWADIYFATPDIYIPDISNTPSYTFADLVISIHNDAPPTSHAIIMTAKAPSIHRISRTDLSVSIHFFVG